mmetsp:Transcript_86955/g.186271  ORF Transcript_86955/g.186271 Transcript_86955/m.186271 type:complete len:375 (-) Transcript_86955:2096-3220(-)
MVTRAFDHSDAARISHPEALPNAPAEENLAARRTVEASVARNHVVLGREGDVRWGVGNNASAIHALAHIVVALADHFEVDALDVPDTQGLPCRAREGEVQLPAEAIVAVLPRNGPSDAAAHGSLPVGDRHLQVDHAHIVVDGAQDILPGQEIVVKRRTVGVGRAIECSANPDFSLLLVRRGGAEEPCQVDPIGLGELLVATGWPSLLTTNLRGRWRLRDVCADLSIAPGPEKIASANDLIKGAEPQSCEDHPYLLCDKQHEVSHMLGSAWEFLAQSLLLRCYTHRTAVHMADPRHDASLGDHHNTTKTELLSAHHSRYHNIPPSLEAAVNAQGHPVPETIGGKDLLGLGQANFPRAPGVHNAAQGRSSCAPIVS